MLGWPEILLILTVMLLVFGPSKLPEMARSLGKAFREFQVATTSIEKEAKAFTESLPDLNTTPLGVAPMPYSQRVQDSKQALIMEAEGSKTAEEIVTTTSNSPSPIKPQTETQLKTAIDDDNLKKVAKLLGVDAEGKEGEDLRKAIHDKIEGLEKKEV